MKKTILVILAFLLITVSSVTAQTETMTNEELTMKVADLESQINEIITFLNDYFLADATPYVEPAEAEVNAKDPFAVHGIGDVVEDIDRTITLNSAMLKEGILVLEFTVTNSSNGKIEVGSYYFSAKNDDGVMLDKEYYTCSSSGLDMVLIPGDKVKGNICFTYVDPAPVKIYYEPDYMRDDIYIWSISK